MPTEYINCETFRVIRAGEHQPKLSKGWAVVMNPTGNRKFADPRLGIEQLPHDYFQVGKPYGFLIDPDRPPEVEGDDLPGLVSGFAIEAEREGAALKRLRAYSLMKGNTARAALLALINPQAPHEEKSEYSPPKDLDLSDGAEVLDFYERQDLGPFYERQASSTISETQVVLLPERRSVGISAQHGRSFDEAGGWRAIYLPWKGLVWERHTLASETEQEDETGEEPDEGGSDREPRQPISPYRSGAAEAEVPEDELEEDVSAISSLEIEELDEQRAEAE